MPTYLHPGVYVEEISGGARPIEAVGTSTAAFVGIAEKGPIDEARFVTNFTEFQEIYGGYVSDNDIGTSYLAYSVFQFFQNGGSACYVVRVENGAETAELRLYTSEGTYTMTVKAISPGSWGNGLRIAIGAGTTSEEGFNMYVLKGDEIVEIYEDISMVNSSSFYVDRVTKRSLYIRTESKNLPDNPEYTGKIDLSSGVDLTKVSKIKLQIDNAGPYTIDCAEGGSGTVDIDLIMKNINDRFFPDFNKNVASIVTVAGKKYIKLTSPTATTASKIVFTAPDEKDATRDIFGLQESSWVIKGSNETIAQAFGLETALNIHTNLAGSPTIAIGLGTNTPTSISLTQGVDFRASLFSVISAINTALGNEIAYTDGAHVILSTNQDITIAQANANLILGSSCYSYVHTGSGDNPAKIEGSLDVATVNGDIKLKIDNHPSFVVALLNGDSAETVANKINAAYQKISKGNKKVADTNTAGTRLILTSIAKGTSGRIIVSSHTGTDSAASVLGTAHQNAADYIIPAETQSVAILNGTEDLSSGIGPALGSHTLRMSSGDDPVQFTISSLAAATVQQLFTNDFAGVTALNYHILTSGTTVKMVVASTSIKPELRFSIPLISGLETEIHDPAAGTHAAYVRLFGNIAPFTGNAHVLPQYTYRFGLPDNNPKKTVIVSGEDMDFSQSLSLSKGKQDRGNENTLSNLTVGSVSGKTSGLRLLDKLTDISILGIPGWSGMGESTAKTFIDGGTAYCDKVRPSQARPLRDLFFVTNTSADVTKPENAKKFVREDINYKSSGGYAAIYYPWVTVNDPIGTASPTISIPPAGMVAGLYASIDGRRGVWKAPAGTEAGLAGVVKLADQVNDIKQDLLNPHGVNAIRRMPGAGIVAWGARTLATNPEWKYIPVRRMAIMMEVSIYEGIQWAVFESNDEPLWSLLRLNINAFMTNLFRNGAFQGSSPEEAFFVKCDAETTTQVDIDLGKVNILVGFAPLKPAEFVIVKISQKAGQTE